MLGFLKNLYFRIGIHTAPPGTLFSFLHKNIFRAYVGAAIVTGYQKRLLLRRGEKQATASAVDSPVTIWHPPYRDAEQVRRILLLKLDHIGDFVIGIPTFRLMRDTFPKAEITLLCGGWNKDLAERTGLFDHVVRVDVVSEVSGEVKGVSVSREVLATLSSLPDFDIAVDVKVEADTRGVLSYIRADYKAGYESHESPADMALSLIRPPEGAWNEPEKERHTCRLLYMLASAVAADFQPRSAIRQSLNVIADSVNSDPLSLELTKLPVIGINTGSGTVTKKWPLERFAALVECLIRDAGATVVLFGSKQDSQDARHISTFVKSERLIDCTEKLTLPEFTAALRRLDLFIGNDTGTTHLAAGMGIPTVCLFSGVSALGRFAPSLGDKVSVLYRAVPCAPCHLPTLTSCPREHLCMRSLTVDHVMEETIRILSGLKPQKARVHVRPTYLEAESRDISRDVA